MTFTFKIARRLAIAYAVSLLFVLAQTSCGEPQIAGLTSPPDTSAVALQVSPRLDTTRTGQPVQLHAVAVNAAGDPVPAPVDWSATGGTVDTTGRFSATTAGSYFVRARHRNHTTVQDSATVVVLPTPVTLTRVILTPATASLVMGATQQFAVSGQWSDGSTTAPAVSYSATGGTITAGGLYTAGSTAGSFRVIAVQQGGTLADTSAVSITPPVATLTSLILAPSSVSLAPSATQQFTVSGTWSDGSTTTPAVSYSATGGTITGGGLYTAGSTAGSFRVIAVQQGGTLADTSAVTVTAPVVTLTRVILTPATASLVTGATQQFAVSGQWSDGSTTAPAVSYSATGGSITAGGLYTAGSTAGSFRVIAVQQGGTLADTSAVTVTAPVVTLTRVILTPATASLVTGATQQFAVSGQWSDGSTTAPAVTYSATGGSITAGGLYTAGSTAGSFRVIAVQQGGTLADTSAVSITAPAVTLTSLVLAPATVTLSTGGTQQFTVSGTWSDGSTTTPAVSYSATGGTITAGGLYTAGSTAGSFRVIASHVGGTLKDTAAVTISSAGGTVLVSEGFEDGNLASRGWFDATTVATTTDARPGSSGTHALQWHWTQGMTAPQGSSRLDFAPSTSVYLSYWVKQSANWIGSGVSYHPHMFHFLTTADDHWIGPSHSHLTLYDELFYRAAQGGSVVNLALQDALMIDSTKLMVDLTSITEQRAIGGYNGRPEPGLQWDAYLDGTEGYTNYKILQPTTIVMTDATKNGWHHVESYWQLNTISGGRGQANGVVQYWFDGVQLVDRHDIYFRTNANPTMQFRTFLMAPYIGVGSPRDQYMWIDDVVIMTAKP